MAKLTKGETKALVALATEEYNEILGSAFTTGKALIAGAAEVMGAGEIIAAAGVNSPGASKAMVDALDTSGDLLAAAADFIACAASVELALGTLLPNGAVAQITNVARELSATQETGDAYDGQG